MSELVNEIWVEKYRPIKLEDIILEHKNTINSYLKNKTIPSFIFTSNSPGTGKTTLAILISNILNCDLLKINSSDERGIDTIREKVKLFASSMSSSYTKRCILLDEACGLTGIAQDSMRAIIETYSDNCFFILSCNNYSKIIEPIKSRCITINFDNPPKDEIFDRLKYICSQEKLTLSDTDILNIIDTFYPDIRTCIKTLQKIKIENKTTFDPYSNYYDIEEAIKKSDINYIYNKVFEGNFDIIGFTKYFFKKIFENFDNIGFAKASKVTQLLADIVKSYEINVNLEIVFLANMVEIINILK